MNISFMAGITALRIKPNVLPVKPHFEMPKKQKEVLTMYLGGTTCATKIAESIGSRTDAVKVMLIKLEKKGVLVYSRVTAKSIADNRVAKKEELLTLIKNGLIDTKELAAGLSCALSTLYRYLKELSDDKLIIYIPGKNNVTAIIKIKGCC